MCASGVFVSLSDVQFLDHVSTSADRDTLSSSQIANLQQQLETARAAQQL
jgi:hypothetical protein